MVTAAHLRLILKRATLLGGAVALFLLIDAGGQSLQAPPPSSIEGPRDAAGSPHALRQVLLALTAVVFCGAIAGRMFRWVGQPPVIGEVLAGIMLGPSLLGRIAPEAQMFLLPPAVAPDLGIIAQFGAILYMFLLGLEVDDGLLKRQARETLLISQASIIAPLLLGAALALVLYPRLSNAAVPFTHFALFLGVAMSITAFPVLARIVKDRGIHNTPLGALALACAAINDVVAWCLLALVVGMAHSQVSDGLAVVIGAGAFVAIMLIVARPFAQRFTTRAQDTETSRSATTVVFIAVLLSALAAEWIGIHAIFGAFLLGAIVPHNSGLARTFTAKLEDLITIVFLPAYFAYTGLRTQIGILDCAEDWSLCGLIIMTATIGKFGGTCAAARLAGRDWRDAASLGILMNTRGLMELIVLNVGLDLHIISPKLFAMMVLMALATTIATTPLLQLLARSWHVGGFVVELTTADLGVRESSRPS